MIKIENSMTYGWEEAIRGMRNPLNSWDKSDSEIYDGGVFEFSIGPNDLNLMTRLAKGGSTHAKYRRMITVYVDITAPLYWWKEFDTYKVGTVANSCSTMHKIHEKEFTLDDFSHEHLVDDTWDVNIHGELETLGHFKDKEFANFYYSLDPDDLWFKEGLELLIARLNTARTMYLKTKNKKYWWQMIQLLPSSYNQKRTVMFNYEVLTAILHDRANHKLDEWHILCDWIKTLPYANEIII